MITRYELSDCPVCGAHQADTVVDGDGIRRELEALWEHHTAEGDVALPRAQLTDRLAFSQRPPLAVVRCRDCGLLYRNPRERGVRELYEREPQDAATLARLHDAQQPDFAPVLERLTALHGDTGGGLEVGSYAGAFLAAAAQAAWDFEGVDVNPEAVAFLRQRGYRVSAGSIEDTPAASAHDVVAFVNCFDQLEDPAAAAAAAHRRLRPDGLLVVRVPNGEFYASLRAHLDGGLAGAATSLLARHNLLGFPYRHGFTPGSLERLLATTGFALLEASGAGVLPASDGAGFARERLLDAAELALRPLLGAPWLELYARRV